MVKLSIFSGTRAEYGLMKNLIQYLQKDNFFDLNVIVSGTHLESEYGNTINEIKKDGININASFAIPPKTNSKIDMAFQTSEIIKFVSSNLEKFKSDYLIILGDRFESFGAATAAHLLGIKNIHLHGGESTIGALDDKLRHAISQLSTYHFTSAEVHKNKVIDLIGSSKNVYNVGPLVLDALLDLNFLSYKEFEEKTGYIFSKRNLLITFHPETLSFDQGISNFEKLLKVLANSNCNILFTAPNADFGSAKIIRLIKEFCAKHLKRSLYLPSLGQELYLNAIILFDCVIGNSSSGIIEAQLLNSQVINVGDRQKGRFRFGKVMEAYNDIDRINYLVNKVLNCDVYDNKSIINFKKKYLENIPSKKIVSILKASI